MLLYNHKQEFMGIDEEGLKLLNYSSFEELLKVCTDVADLFANEPGYIYNFKNFGWIDFILHSDSDVSNALVHANGRVFSCRLAVTSFYLRDDPSQNMYRIEMSHIKSVSGEEVRPHIITPREAPREFVPPRINVSNSAPSSLPDHSHIAPTRLSEPSVLDIPTSEFSEYAEEVYTDFAPSPKHIEASEPLDFSFVEENIQELQPITPTKPFVSPPLEKEQYTNGEKEYLSHHKVRKDYLFDPNIAANELGLPVDLIEEFIGDFIQQSYEFKKDLFEACAKNDFNSLHILSHKLKGVAANLRIEDALETLSIINISTELGEVEANLKYYYNIVAKLEGKESDDSYTQSSLKAIIPETIDESIYAFTLKQHDNEPLIAHTKEAEILDVNEDQSTPKEVPFKIEEPEKAVTLIIEESVEVLPEALHHDAYSTARILGIDSAFMSELLSDFKQDANNISEQITNAISAFDTAAWNESASNLKGISDNLRLNEISDELAVLIKT
ncbi:MAG: Hpt domain-containing protein, partial [Sulfuricurvum sp.]